MEGGRLTVGKVSKVQEVSKVSKVQEVQKVQVGVSCDVVSPCPLWFRKGSKVQKVQEALRCEPLCRHAVVVQERFGVNRCVCFYLRFKKLTAEHTEGGTQSTQRVCPGSDSLCLFEPFCLSGPKLKGFKGLRGSRGSRGSSGGSL